MTRKLMEPKERRMEILDCAEELFQIKGYEAATTGDILKKAGIARGTLYYYFKSKNEIMDSVIERRIERQIQNLKAIINGQKINALEKIKKILYQNSIINNENEEMLDYLHQPENSAMHQKTLVAAVRNSAPVLAEIINQGNSEKLFQAMYPQELSEFLLAGMNFLFDPSIFHWSRDEYIKRMHALADILETVLRAEKGSFDFMKSFAEEEGSQYRDKKRL